jgi:hypothetical protein
MPNLLSFCVCSNIHTVEPYDPREIGILHLMSFISVIIWLYLSENLHHCNGLS